MRIPLVSWMFPTGAVLTISGVFLYAALEYVSFQNAQGPLFSVLSIIFFPALVVGTPLAILGSLLDVWQLTTRDARNRGLICLAVGCVSALLVKYTFNVHGWTISFAFPAFAGIVCGLIYLVKMGVGRAVAR